MRAIMDHNRLKWASRRGMLELDLILQPFVENVYPKLNSELQNYFSDLLLCEDQDLFAWLLNRHEPEAEHLLLMVRMIREYAQKKP
jgi:antitoxin CptB